MLEPMTLDPETFEDEYRGEVSPRSGGIAAVLTVLHPSLGYLYVGRAGAALAVAFVYLGYIAAFVAACAEFGMM